MLKYIIELIFVVFLICCQSNKDKFVQYPHLKDKKIVLIDTLPFINKPELSGEKYIKSIKVITLLRSGCRPCIEEMISWKQLIQEKELLQDSAIEFIFIANGKPSYSWNYKIDKEKINFPIFLDRTEIFININKLEELIYENSIVINQNNKIVFIGSPVQEPGLKKSFLRCLKEELSKQTLD